MADKDLIAVSPDKLERAEGFTRAKKHSANFAKRSISAAQLKAARQKAFAPPKIEETQPAPKKIKAVQVTSASLGKLRAVHQSTAATAELVNQKLDPDLALGTTYSALLAYEYTKLKAERQARLRRAKDPKTVEAQWQKIVGAASEAFAAAGLKGLKESDLDRFSRELTRSRANFNAITEISNSGVVVPTGGGPKVAYGHFVTVYDFFTDLIDVVTPAPPDLCERPIEGKYTKHFSRCFSLTVRITYWCPTWTNPFRTCTKDFTLAGVCFSLGLEVGYRITCCGAVAWGQAYAQACATILGVTKCASCVARVVGVAGVGRTGSGSSCSYGLGVNAELKCTMGGITVFYASVPFGWTVTGPCPPASLPC